MLQDGAKLVRDWADVVQELPEHWRRALRAPSTSFRAPSQPSEHTPEGRVLALLTMEEPRQIDELIARGTADASQVSAALVALEIAGWARQLPGQRWVATHGAMADGPARAATEGPEATAR